MTFFTTPELLEIGDIPFTTSLQKPTREEALEYYRKVAEHYDVDIRQYEWVKTVMGEDGKFSITATDRAGRPHDYLTKKVIVSTGYYDLSNQLGIPGEDLPKVSHYYGEPHPYFDTDVMVIGGKNSAAIASLDLWRHGARVTLVYRGSHLHHHVKYWIKPDLENRIKAGEIEAYFNSTVQEIGIDHVVVVTPHGPIRLKNDFVLALIGYHPDYDFLRSMGIELSEEQCRPVCDPVSLESNVPGIYVAGVIVAGSQDERNLHRKWTVSWQADRCRLETQIASLTVRYSDPLSAAAKDGLATSARTLLRTRLSNKTGSRDSSSWQSHVPHPCREATTRACRSF